MPHSPLVSVIIPVYNGEPYLRETLRSALAQDYPALEIIAVNDGSTDGSAVILREFEGKVRVVSQPNAGVAAARNRGLEASTGRYIAFLDQDDLWEKGKTAQQVAFLEAHPELQFVLSRQRFFLHPGSQWPAWFKPQMADNDFTGYVLGAMLARRELLESFSRMDEHYRYADDTAWFFLAKDSNIPMQHLPETGLLRRIHAESASRNVSAIQRELLAVVKASIDRQKNGNSA